MYTHPPSHPLQCEISRRFQMSSLTFSRSRKKLIIICYLRALSACDIKHIVTYFIVPNTIYIRSRFWHTVKIMLSINTHWNWLLGLFNSN